MATDVVPQPTYVSTTVVHVGDRISIVGRRMDLVFGVTLSGRPCDFVINSRNAISVLVPAGATSGVLVVFSARGAGIVAGTISVTAVVPPSRFAGRSTGSQGYVDGGATPQRVTLQQIPICSDIAGTCTLEISNASAAFNATSHLGPNSNMNFALYKTDGSLQPTGSPIAKWLNQTIPGGGVSWTGNFDATGLWASSGYAALLIGNPAASHFNTAPGITNGSYVDGTSTVDPVPGGLSPVNNAVMTTRILYDTARPRIVVDADSLGGGYSAAFAVRREQAAFVRIGPDNDWCVDTCQISGSTLAQWNDGASRPFYRVGQLLSGVVGLTNLSINDLPSLANLAAYQALVAARVSDWQSNGVSKIVFCTLPPNAAYVGQDALRLSINAWLLTQEGVGGIDKVVDAAATVWNPANHSQLAAAFDSGDGTHWNAAGHAAVASAITAKISAVL